MGEVSRRHVEDYRPGLADRPCQYKARLTSATIAHRLGTLRILLRRHRRMGLAGGATASAHVPRGPAQTGPPAAQGAGRRRRAQLLRAAQADARLLVRVTVEVLVRTGLGVSEYTGLRADAVVQIGAGPGLHVPVGKLHDDRYLPLQRQLVALIDAPASSGRTSRSCGPGRTAARWTGTPSPGCSIGPAPPRGWRT
jgi:hypothetical protein